MPDNQDKKPQNSREQASSEQDTPQTSAANVKTQNDVPDDRVTQASQAAQSRRRDENGRFATDDEGHEPQRSSRTRNRQDDDYRGRYSYDDYEARDRGQRNLFEGQDDYRRREREPLRDEDPRGRWAGQSYDDRERYSRDYGDDYRRYSNQERQPERYDERRAWSQTGERRYDDYREPPRSGWPSQGDQQRHRDWERDDQGRYNSRRDYDDDYIRLQRGDRYRDDYDRHPQHDRYRDDRPREYAGSDDRTRYQYNDYRPVDRERSWSEVRHDAGYVPRRGPGRRDDR